MAKAPNILPKDATAVWLEDLRQRGAEVNRRMVGESELNLAFLSGDQWTHYTQVHGVSEIENPADEIRVIENRMLPAFERWLEYHFKESPVITAFEGGEELRDVEAAAAASSLCDYWESNSRWQDVRRQAVAWKAVSGIGFHRVVWRENAIQSRKRKRPAVVETPQPDQSRGGKLSFIGMKEIEEKGDLAFEFLCPLTTYLFPTDATDWTQVRALMYVEAVDKEWLRQHFPKADFEQLKPLAGQDINLDALRRISGVESVLGQYGDSVDDTRYLLIQYFERPTVDYPKGRFLMAAGDAMLTEKDNVLPYIDELKELDPLDQHNLLMGVVPHLGKTSPGRLVSKPLLSQWRPAQVRINDLLTDEARNRQTVGRSKLIYQEGTLDEKQWTGDHGERIAVRRSENPPQYIQGMPLVGIGLEIDRAQMAMAEVTGQTDVLRGQNPTQVRGAFHLDILREESMTLINADVETEERAYVMAAKIALAIAKARYSRERIVEIVGRDRTSHALTLKSAHIETDIRLKEGSMRPRNHALREAKLIELLQYGAFIDERTGRPKMRKFWDMTELGTMNQSVDPEHRQYVRAREENTRMLLYCEIIQPFEHEDHFIHTEEHTGAMARPEFYDSPPPVQQVMLSHLEAHREYIMRDMAPQVNEHPDPVSGLGDTAGKAMNEHPLPRDSRNPALAVMSGMGGQPAPAGAPAPAAAPTPAQP